MNAGNHTESTTQVQARPYITINMGKYMCTHVVSCCHIDDKDEQARQIQDCLTRIVPCLNVYSMSVSMTPGRVHEM